MSEANPLVSTIIPTFNSAAYLGEAIRSALEQTYPKLQIIVVNDGSTDSTKQIAQEFGSRIIYIEQENRGPACARNVGIVRADGVYTAFLDADDVWELGKIEAQVKAISDDETIGLVYTKMMNFSDRTGERLGEWPSKVRSGWIFDKLLLAPTIPLPSVLVKTTLLRELGGFDERLLTAEDTNLLIKIAMRNRILGLDSVLVKRRLHAGNLSNRFDINVGTLDNLDIIAREYPKYHPKRYGPMKQAYLIRGKELIKDSLYNNEFALAHRTSLRVLRYYPFNLSILVYWLITCFPEGGLKRVRRILRFLRAAVNVH